MTVNYLNFEVFVETNHFKVHIDEASFHEFCADAARRSGVTDRSRLDFLNLFLLLEEISSLKGEVLIAFSSPSQAHKNLRAADGKSPELATSVGDLEKKIAPKKFDHIIFASLLAHLPDGEDQRLINKSIDALRPGGSLHFLPLPLSTSHSEQFRPELPEGERLEKNYDRLSFIETVLKGKKPFYDLDILYYANSPALAPEISELRSLKMIKRAPGLFRKLEDSLLGASEVHYYKEAHLPVNK